MTAARSTDAHAALELIGAYLAIDDLEGAQLAFDCVAKSQGLPLLPPPASRSWPMEDMREWLAGVGRFFHAGRPDDWLAVNLSGQVLAVLGIEDPGQDQWRALREVAEIVFDDRAARTLGDTWLRTALLGVGTGKRPERPRALRVAA